MAPIKKHPSKKWEVSIIAFQDAEGSKFKVTRRLPDLSVSETKIFSSMEKAQKQFEEWLE